MESLPTTTRSHKKGILFFLPIIAFPFLAFLFWALGGGKGGANGQNSPAGLNTKLPDANLPKEEATDKMSFYDQAEQRESHSHIDTSDSEHFLPDATQDGNPNGKVLQDGDVYETSPYDYSNYAKNRNGSERTSASHSASNERQIKEKLSQLERQINEPEKNTEMNGAYDKLQQSNLEDKLADAQKGIQSATISDDPDREMTQLQEMMGRIYDIQHPEVVQDKLKQESQRKRGVVFPVTAAPHNENITLLEPYQISQSDSTIRLFKQREENGFFGLDDIVNTASDETDKGVAAVVQDNTTVVTGATIKLRLLQSIYVDGVLIPAGQFIAGVATVTNDRIQIAVESILYHDQLFTVKLTGYDTDGLEGLYVPGSINRSVINQSANNSLQSIGVSSLNPSVAAQATSAGIDAAKNLLTKKLKLTQVYIKAGHKLLMKASLN